MTCEGPSPPAEGEIEMCERGERVFWEPVSDERYREGT